GSKSCLAGGAGDTRAHSSSVARPPKNYNPPPRMKPPTARRAQQIQPFEVMDVLSRAHALEAQGRRVVHMEIGEPDFTAPQPVVEAGVRALRDGLTAYTAALGLTGLREAIAAHYA